MENVLIGIVTFQRNKELKELLKKIEKYYPLSRILIFSNSNNPNLRSYLGEKFCFYRSRIKLSEETFLDYTSLDSLRLDLQACKKNIYIENTENIGGSGGIGAIQYISANVLNYPFLWLIDDESIIYKDTLKELVRCINRDESIGIVGSVLIDSKGKIQEAGCKLNRTDFQFIPLLQGKSKTAIKKKTRCQGSVDYVSFTSVLLRSSMFKTVGLMKNFFIHVDDAEYCLRAKKKGFKVVIAYKSIVGNKVVKKQDYSIYDLRNYLFVSSSYFTLKEKIILYKNILRKLIYAFFFNKKAYQVIKIALFTFLKGTYGKVELRNTI